MSLLIEPLMKCWMVDDVLLSDSDSVALVVYLVHKLEILRMSCMCALLFDTEFIGLDVPDLSQLVIGSGSQSYEGY